MRRSDEEVFDEVLFLGLCANTSFPAAGLVAMDVAIGLFLVGLTATVS